MGQNMLALYLIFATGFVLIGAGLFNWKLLTESNASDYLKNKFGQYAWRIILIVFGILVLLMAYYAWSTGKFARPI